MKMQISYKRPVSFLLRHFTFRQIAKNPTRKNAALVLIFTNMSTICVTPNVIAAIGLSDHYSVLCILKKMQINKQTQENTNPPP